MNSLVVLLSPSPASPEAFFRYWVTGERPSAVLSGSAQISELPRGAGDKRTETVIAVVPAEKLSWHRLTLPPGIHARSPRLRAVLEGMLEERLLDAPEAMHFALEPGAASGSPVWVAACHKAWLRASIESLELAGLAVSRIVPEFAPSAAGEQLYVRGTPEKPQMVVCGKRSVVLLPACSEALELMDLQHDQTSAAACFAEPDVGELAHSLLGGRIQFQTSEERMMVTVQSSWNLAQFEMSTSRGSRSWKRVIEGLGALMFNRQWRTLRWGMGLLLLVNVVGLNAWAWKERSQLREKQLAIRDILAKTFPKVSPIVEPLTQMERELALLKRSTGVLSARDLEAMLGVLAVEAPAVRIGGALDFASDELKIKGMSMSTSDLTLLNSRLERYGYAARTEGDQLVVKAEVRP